METPPDGPAPIEELPENMQWYFNNKKQTTGCYGNRGI
jgi:hypothetical protein